MVAEETGRGEDQIERGVSAAPLPPGIGELLADWQVRLAAIEAAQEPAPEDLNQMKWDLGRDICSVIEAAAAESARTPLIKGIADRLECSGSLIYNLTNVARAFPDGLPRQRWDMLARLARMKPEERNRLLADLPDWAPTRSLSRQGRPRQASPEDDANRRESQSRATRLAAARAEVQTLHPVDRIDFTLELIRTLDLSPLSSAEQGCVVEEFEGAIIALRQPLPNAAAEAATRELGRHGRSSPSSETG